MDANAHSGPPERHRNVTTRAKIRIALCASAVVLIVPALVLLVPSFGVTDPAALRPQRIAGCLVCLGLLCGMFSAYLGPASPETPRWVIPTGIALAVLMLALVFCGLTLYAFAFPSAEGLAATLMLIASLGLVVDAVLATLMFGTDRRRVQAR